MQKYKTIDSMTGETIIMTLEEVLFEINRDHSDEWTDYDESDWEEGWLEWVSDVLPVLIEEEKV